MLRRAIVAAEAIFSNDPDTESFLPVRVAEAEPTPATVAGWMPNAGTGASRPLYFSALCACKDIPIKEMTVPMTRLPIIVFFNVIPVLRERCPKESA
jgi:hypothetical protein